jgi:hypothetical protein
MLAIFSVKSPVPPPTSRSLPFFVFDIRYFLMICNIDDLKGLADPGDSLVSSNVRILPINVYSI